MPDSNIPKDVASSLASIFTNINFERLSEIVVAIILAFIGFVIARLVSNASFVQLEIVLMPINACYGVEGFFILFSCYLL